MHFKSLDKLIKYIDVHFDINKDGEKLGFMKGYVYRRDKIPVQVSLEGTHYEMGLQYGVLLNSEIRKIAHSLYKVIEYYSNEIKIHKNLVYIYFNYKINKLSKNLPERFRQEMKGISDGSGIDISAIYAINLFDDLLHVMGCSSILALSDDSNIVHGWNEDLYFGMELGMKQVIIKCNPTGYNSFVYVAFPGFIGVAGGYSDKGLGYSHHSRFANGVDYKGYPQNCISRMALEECSSLKEVIDFYRNKTVVVADAHTWSDRNSLTGCIIETAPNAKEPVKVIEMSDKVLWHINKYMNSDYIKNNESKYAGDVSFNNARQEVFNYYIRDTNKTLALDDVISLLRIEKGPSGENYNSSDITRGICNMDTQHMMIFEPKGEGIYFARNYYLASKSTVYFIPANFDTPPYVYMESEKIDPVIEDFARIKESILTKSEQIKKLKQLTVKYPDQGYIYFMTGQASLNAGDLAGWAEYTDKAFKSPSSCDIQEVTLEKAKIEFYKKNMEEAAKILSTVRFDDLRSFKSRAELLYICKMYYEFKHDKTSSDRYRDDFQELVRDIKTRSKIVKGLKFRIYG